MRIETFTTHYMASHGYLLIEGSHAIVIDPGEAEPIIAFVEREGLILDFGILTHEHCDHTQGCTEIRNRFGCRIIASTRCDENLNDPRSNLSRYFAGLVAVQKKVSIDQQREIKPFSAHADMMFHEELAIRWRGHTIICHETPGHSEGSICIVVDEKFMFSGDTLMWGERTNTRFKGGNEKLLREVTIPWIQSLKEDITVYAGHGDQFKLRDRLKEEI